MTTKPAGDSIADLNARKAAETPFEFEATGPDGKPSGHWFSVIGGQCYTVVTATQQLVNARRSQDAERDAKASLSRPGDNIVPVEDDVAFGQRIAAVRLVGWRGPGDTQGLDAEQLERFRGISDPFSPALALVLCQTNPDYAAQFTIKSNQTANFIKASSTT